MPERDRLEVDVLFVGAGPASLAGAIRLGQLAQAAGRALEILVIEKGGEIGNHGLSGAVMDPRALDELLPDWRDRRAGRVARDERRAVVPDRARQDQSAVDAAAAKQSRQVRHLAAEAVQVARRSRRGGRRARLSRVSGSGAAVGRRPRHRRAHGRQGPRPRRPAQAQLRTGRRYPRQGRRPGRRPARNARQSRRSRNSVSTRGRDPQVYAVGRQRAVAAARRSLQGGRA